MTRLTLVAGLPGAGKTTYARALAERTGAVRLCPDEWLLALCLDPYDSARRLAVEHQLCSHALALLRGGTSVILEFGFWVRSERDQLREAARAIGVEVSLVGLEAPLEERWRRIEGRDPVGSVRMTRDELASWESWWEPVTAEEQATYDPAQ